MVESVETVFRQLLGGQTHLGYGSTRDAFETQKNRQAFTAMLQQSDTFKKGKKHFNVLYSVQNLQEGADDWDILLQPLLTVCNN